MAEPMRVDTPPLWTPPDTFASRLRQLRYGLGNPTVKEIATACGIPAATWNTWENGKRPQGMNEKVAAIVAGVRETYGVDVNRDWLMWGGTSSAWFTDSEHGSASQLAFWPTLVRS